MMASRSGLASAFFGIRSTAGGLASPEDQHVRGVITASAMAPLDFARVILARLKVSSPAALDAWCGPYKTREPSYDYALMEALGSGGQA